MNYVECAIIMAAGIGNRMRPITLTTPKPLVKVNGVRMIDTVIQGLHHNGIKEIFVVVGYLILCFFKYIIAETICDNMDINSSSL